MSETEELGLGHMLKLEPSQADKGAGGEFRGSPTHLAVDCIWAPKSGPSVFERTNLTKDTYADRTVAMIF